MTPPSSSAPRAPMRVIRHRERETEYEYALEVRIPNRGYYCTVSKRLAGESKSAQWWASRGNIGMAENETERWAFREALRMAAHAFRQGAASASKTTPSAPPRAPLEGE